MNSIYYGHAAFEILRRAHHCYQRGSVVGSSHGLIAAIQRNGLSYHYAIRFNEVTFM